MMEEAPIMPLSYAGYRFLVKPWVRSYRISATDSFFWKDVIIEAH
jgi:ABC-type transport system substrate-binding protein